MKKRGSSFLTFALVSTLLLTGCGTPSKTYATNKDAGVYFSLPHSWKKISQTELSAREGTSTAAGAADRLASVIWQEAYSPKLDLTPADVLSLKTSDAPIVYVRVRDLNGDEINSISYNALRNIIVPLTSWFDGTGTVPAFDISVDEERVEKGGRGVHSVFWYQANDGTSQTINQVALLSNDHTRIYILIVRCSKKCYADNQDVLEEISNSFTVRGVR